MQLASSYTCHDPNSTARRPRDVEGLYPDPDPGPGQLMKGHMASTLFCVCDVTSNIIDPGIFLRVTVLQALH